ncbi:hypothetical protein [Actimicrobium antarcticum]|uniref:hypothetical protein n=1 Tax=Actimicrobium antarcticum TaxID=1051899 RepID=UPI0031DF80A5
MLGFAAMPFKVGLFNSLIYIGFHFEKLKPQACNSLKINTKILHLETHSFAAQATKLILLPYPIFGSGLFTRNSTPSPALVNG